MPPEPSSCVTRNVPASTSPVSGSSAFSAPSSDVASFGQTRKSGGYYAPHTGQRRVRGTAMVGASFDVIGGTLLCRGIVGEVRTEPALRFGERHSFSSRVTFHLRAIDFSDCKIARLRVPDVDAADARRGQHREMFR